MFDSDKLKQIINTPEVKINIADLKSHVLLKDQGVDSLEMMNITLAIEENLNISIPDDDIGKLNTLDKIAEYINNKLR